MSINLDIRNFIDLIFFQQRMQIFEILQLYCKKKIVGSFHYKIFLNILIFVSKKILQIILENIKKQFH